VLIGFDARILLLAYLMLIASILPMFASDFSLSRLGKTESHRQPLKQ
jgi:hypothetical protein